MMTYLSLAALVAVACLGWNLSRRFGSDRISVFTERRRSTSGESALEKLVPVTE